MMAPSMAVVRKIRSPQTMGEECPRPSTGVFHFTFLVAPHSVGNPVSVETPWPSGPRHCAQFAALPAGLAFGGLVIEVESNSAALKKLVSDKASMTKGLFISFFAQKFGHIFQFCFSLHRSPRFVRLYRRLKEGALWPTSGDICYGRPENVFSRS